ncbi:ABC transporter substrate-binding protein [Burkholderia multivorans]|uniref:ABC transporter substrate-binding protein n=1 Tax=Burkholderia multivorans TaxID=87883 RepID=UPI001C224838|nr:ABC transporter substrate-binding protein [Burkholderia multivorans]MBU9224636.1 ABC transporter substrate-binding protein [Burkholderia multivorans]MBU9420552.1 ABC transporter substrate-binding protein [Burkholderia multivorans]
MSRKSTAIVVGTLQDMSGAVAANGSDFLRGMELRFSEQNSRGGIHGLPIDLQVIDSRYEPIYARQACRRWLADARPLAMINNVGAAVVEATMGDVLNADVLHLFPIAGIESSYEPLHPLTFQSVPSYQTAVRQALCRLTDENQFGRNEIGVLYQDDAFGRQILKAAEHVADARGGGLACVRSFSRGATSFDCELAHLRSGGCRLLVLGTMVNETLIAIQWCTENQWRPTILVTPSAYSARLHEVGGRDAEGIFAASYHSHPYEDSTSLSANWARTYRAAFGFAPSAWALVAYLNADAFVQAMLEAQDVTSLGAREVLSDFSIDQSPLGGHRLRFTNASHLGTGRTILSKIEDGKWQLVTELPS